VSQQAPESGETDNRAAYPDEVDPYDEQDSVATEVAIATAITAVLANPVDARDLNPAKAKAILESAVKMLLTHYGQRVLTQFLHDWRGRTSDPQNHELIRSSVYDSVEKVLDDTAKTVVQIANAAKTVETAPGPNATYEQGLHESAAEAFNRLSNGLTEVSRLLTTRTREEVKLAYATSLGATGKVWRTRRDGKVRTVHADLEGHFERLRDPFPEINGDRLQYPGDPDAPLRSTINCRCRLSYRMPLGQVTP
jgi:hypothetical protein